MVSLLAALRFAAVTDLSLIRSQPLSQLSNFRSIFVRILTSFSAMRRGMERGAFRTDQLGHARLNAKAIAELRRDKVV